MTIDLQDRTHTIQRGDTFRSLAQRFYDNADRWLLIREENARSRRLQALPPPGQSITIPGADTLWRRMDQAISQFRDNFQVYAPFVGADRVDMPDPVLLPPRPDRSQGRGEINIDFFGLVQVIDDRSLPAVENDDFKITWVPNEPERVGFANEIKLGLTVKTNNVWKGDPAARKALAASFVDLLTRLENLEVKEERLISGATEHIRRRLAQTLPATFEESLSLRYGLNLGYGADNAPYVDLLPGMTLRLDQTMRQFVGPGSSANGLVNAGTVNFTIARDADGRISFDPFLSAISSPQSGRRAGVFPFVGGFDLQAAGAARRHARLFFPTKLPDPAQPSGDPAVQLGRHVAIVLADTLPDLARATQAYVERGELATATPGNAPILAVALPEWAAASPHIQIWVSLRSEQHVWMESRTVPLSTTVRQLVDQLMPGQYLATPKAQRGPGVNRFITLRRLWSQPAPGLASDNDDTPVYRELLFRPDTDHFLDPAIYDLPLVDGDQLILTIG